MVRLIPVLACVGAFAFSARNEWDCAYPGVEVLRDGTVVTTTYGSWTEGEQPYIVSVRLTLAGLDRQAGTK